jgi:pyrroline-5-carboxylate reductase
MKIAFIGGGNMAAALLTGLLRQDVAPGDVHVVEPNEARRGELLRDFGVTSAAAPKAAMRDRDAVVLAVKPQQMHAACTALRPFVAGQVVVSIAAGIRAVDLVRWLGTERIVRTMPNTPALIGRGVSGMMALPAVDVTARALAERILRACGDVVWFDSDAQIDAVTAVSGSGPAYVFYFIEAMIAAGAALGFDDKQSRKLAVDTVLGAAHLAAASDEPLAVLRERVTSKGGTTAAALAALETDAVKESIVRAIRAAAQRATQLGDEFGRH